MAIIILTATLFQYSLMNFPRASGFELELILLTVLFLSIAILHEMIHLLALKLLRVKIYKVKLVKFMAVPLALMVLYDEMTITQYLVGVPFTTNTDNTIHSPSTSSKNKCKSLLLQRTSPYPLFTFCMYYI
ncbi:MAG: hypothetical protein DRJ64_03410 [Thermoprotei archaeon]|nr:MAG: hypothetical protein DRJ64_03410 [Thermoprotei archaeon]